MSGWGDADQGPRGPSGANGSNGSNGTNGADGKTVRYGTGAPSNGLGADGDFYIATDTSYIYGPKASGVWPTGASIIGPAGTNGNTVLTTSGAPSNGTGANGDFAYDPAAKIMYGPKAAGTWPAGVSLAGTNGTDASASAWRMVLCFGASNLGTGSLTDAYLWPPGFAVSSISPTALSFRNRTGKTLKLLAAIDAQQVAGVGTNNTTTFTVQVSSSNVLADTSATVVLGNTATRANALAPTAPAVTWPNGEDVAVTVDRTGGVAGAATHCMVTLVFGENV